MGTCTAEFGEGRLGADAFWIVSDQDQHLSRSAGGHPVRLDELGRLLGGKGLKLRLVGLDLGVQRQPAAGDRT